MARSAEEYQIKAPAYLRISKIIAYIMYVWVIIGIIVLGLRVFLLAFSANATTPFVEFIYKTSADYLNPFRGIFPPKPISETGYLDVASIFAIIIYMLIGWGFSELIQYVQDLIDRNKQKQLVLNEAVNNRERPLNRQGTTKQPSKTRSI